MTGPHDARLVPAAGAAWAAAWAAAAGLAWQAVVCAIALLAIGLVATALLGGRRRRVLAAMVALAAVAALAATGVGAAERAAAICDAQVLAESGVLHIEAVVHDEPRALDGGQRRWMTPARIVAWHPDSTSGRPDQCRLRADAAITLELGERVARGERVRVEGTASWSGDGEAVMWRARLVDVRPQALLLQWRQAFESATTGLPPQVQGLVRGMITGDTTAMPATQVDDMRTAGLAHLTAVSGAHFAILIAAAGAVVSASRAPRLVRASAVAAVAGGFAAIVGPEASVVRALAMASAVALGIAWGRPARGLPALAAGVLALVLLSPGIATSLGFAMSVAAVAAIVLWSPAIARVLARRMPPGIARVASVPIVAQAAVTPLLLVMEPGLTPYAVPANLVAGLAVPAVMGLGAGALVVSPASADGAGLLAHAAAVAAHPIAWVAQAAASAPGARLSWIAGPWGIALAVLVLVALIAATATRVPGAMRAVAAVAACLGTVAGLGLAGTRTGPALADWDVVACDVGQGDMMLLRAGPHSAVVIDTGPDADLARACLEDHGVREVPLLILTHPHADHDGAVSAILVTATVEAAWISAAGSGGAAEATLRQEGVPVEIPAAGQRADPGSAQVTVLSTLHQDLSVGTNDASIAVMARADGASVLALGDLEEAGQRSLLSSLGDGVSVDAVKVAHHGSAVQTEELASHIDAPLVLVSVGADNGYGHPAASALDLYGEGRVVLRTDQCGHAGLARDAHGLRWSPCPIDVAR